MQRYIPPVWVSASLSVKWRQCLLIMGTLRIFKRQLPNPEEEYKGGAEFKVVGTDALQPEDHGSLPQGGVPGEPSHDQQARRPGWEGWDLSECLVMNPRLIKVRRTDSHTPSRQPVGFHDPCLSLFVFLYIGHLP